MIIGAGVVGPRSRASWRGTQLNSCWPSGRRRRRPARARRTPRSCTPGSTRSPAAWRAGCCAAGSALLRRYAAGPGSRWSAPARCSWPGPRSSSARLPAIEAKARRNGYLAVRRSPAGELYRREPQLGPGALGALEIPDEGIICPWTTPLAFATEAVRRRGAAAARYPGDRGGRRGRTAMELGTTRGPLRVPVGGQRGRARSDAIDRMFGGDGFTINPRRGELIVFDKLRAAAVGSILLPVPTARTKGVLVAPTVYGNVLLGPDCRGRRGPHGHRHDRCGARRPGRGRAADPARAGRGGGDRDLRRPARRDRARGLPDRRRREAAIRVRGRHPVDRAVRFPRHRRVRRGTAG